MKLVLFRAHLHVSSQNDSSYHNIIDSQNQLILTALCTIFFKDIGRKNYFILIESYLRVQNLGPSVYNFSHTAI